VRSIQIPKKNGTFRTIYIPNKKEKISLREILVELNNKQLKLCGDFVHGFIPGRSPVTNALAHIGYEYTTVFDLKDFFDTVKKEQVQKYLTAAQCAAVFVDGAPRQGLPTSPAVANLAAIALDDGISKWIKKNNLELVYTRYADDLSFSYNDKSIEEKLLKAIPNIIGMNGFVVNKKKTRTLTAKAGRRHITGVGVDATNIYPTRSVKRKLRAARYRNNYMQAKGLLEWSKLKLPVPKELKVVKKPELTLKQEITIIKKLWGVRGKLTGLPDKGPDEWLSDDIVITGDPIYMIGMSSITDNWVSCMGFPNKGCNRQKVVPLCHLEGARIAALLAPDYKSYGGVKRRPMMTRAIVYTLENGDRLYQSVYSKGGKQTQLLCDTLMANKVVPYYYRPRDGSKVIGKLNSKCIYDGHGRVRDYRIVF
jgi:RNA-directed DNA polymerase